MTARLNSRTPGQNQVEYTAEASLPEKGEGTWRTLRMEAGQFKHAGGVALSNWDHVVFFVLNGVNPANKPPVYKRLRWEE